MRPLLIAVTLGVSSALLFGCVTGSNALKQNDPVKAINLAAKHLESFPNSTSAAETLVAAHELAVKEYLIRADVSEYPDDPFRWETSIEAYQQLNYIAKVIESSGAATKLGIKHRFYHEELRNATIQAVALREQLGDDLLSRKDRFASRLAYYHFEKAALLAPEIPNLETKKEQAFHESACHLIIDALPPATPIHWRTLGGANIVETMSKELSRGEVHRFTEFEPAVVFPLSQFSNHHVASLQVTKYDVDTNESSENQSYSKKIETGKTDEYPPKPIYETVTASAVKHTIEEETTVGMNLIITDLATGDLLYQTKTTGSDSWSSSWYSNVSGDKRALPKATRRQSKPRPPSTSRQQREALQEITRKFRKEIKKYYLYYHNEVEAFAIAKHTPLE